MVAMKARKNSNKNPPIFSHEFVIQNHADIVTCVALTFVTGLMVQATSPWAYMFIALHHNVVSDVEEPNAPIKYTTGWKDACAVFFYSLITIVMHTVFQECVFDKISKRLHLSKVKLAKFNESSQLVLFYALSAAWGIDIIIRETNVLFNITSLWMDYPIQLTFSSKLFFIGQLAYWLHNYPELYFQRVKKEDLLLRAIQATIGLAFVVATYILNFQQVGIVLLVLHYLGDVMLHGARIIYFVSKREKLRKLTFLVANSIYVFARVATVAVACLFFLYGLSQAENTFDYDAGNFNTPLIQFSALGCIIYFQGYLSYIFVTRQLKRSRENTTTAQASSKLNQKSKRREAKKPVLSEDDDLPEVDQATKTYSRSRFFTKRK